MSEQIVPPHSIEAEQAVLGCCLLAPTDCIPETKSKLKVKGAFYDIRHQVIFAELVKMEQDAVMVDLITLTQRLKDRGVLESAGGRPYVSSLPDYVAAPAMLGTYLGTVLEKYRQRQVIKLLSDGLRIAGTASPSELKSQIEAHRRKLDELAAPTAGNEIPLENPMAADIYKSLTRYQDIIANQGKLGVQTGFTMFDQSSGGLKPGQMTVVAAETNGGKTTYTLNIIYNALLAGVGVAMFSLEMDRDEMIDMLVSRHCGVNRDVFNTGKFSESDQAKMVGGYGQMQSFPLWIFDAPVQTTSDMEASLLALKGKVGLMVVDYLQIATPTDEREPREQQVAKMARAIRVLAKKFKIPVIVLSQLNEDGKIRESKALAHEANTIIILDADVPRMTMKIVKGRSIRRGSYELDYQPHICTVSSPPIIAAKDRP
jgi:replicative DNA helicase